MEMRLGATRVSGDCADNGCSSGVEGECNEGYC